MKEITTIILRSSIPDKTISLLHHEKLYICNLTMKRKRKVSTNYISTELRYTYYISGLGTVSV